METRLLLPTKENIKTVGTALREGMLAGIPTETVYGLAADALNGKAVSGIFKAKGRPMDNPLIVHISDFSQIDRFSLVREIPKAAYTLAEKFWPGPLTIIMPKGSAIPDEVSAGLDTVAIAEFGDMPFPRAKVLQIRERCLDKLHIQLFKLCSCCLPKCFLLLIGHQSVSNALSYGDGEVGRTVGVAWHPFSIDCKYAVRQQSCVIFPSRFCY